MNGAVLSLLPNAGLGNKLFVWARAAAFAEINNLDCHCLGWSIPRIGPMLRGERRNVCYGRYLKSNLCYELIGASRSVFYHKVYEPPVAEYKANKVGHIFIYNKIPAWNEYFVSIHNHRQIVIHRFFELPRSAVRKSISGERRPIVSVHIRCGDFRELREDEIFANSGNTRTPLTYFIEIIHLIRECSGSCVPITVFSDGTDDKLKPILMLENVARAAALSDFAHLMLMARSDVIVTSAGSTFSMWAGFLSNAAIILHPDHIHSRIRPPSLQNVLYEGPAIGPWREWNQSLQAKIQSLSSTRW